MGQTDEGSFGPLIFFILGLTGLLVTGAEIFLSPNSIVVKVILAVGGLLLMLIALVSIWFLLSVKRRSSNTTSEVDEVPEPPADLDPLTPLKADALKNWGMTAEQVDRLITPEMLRELYSLPKEDLDIVGNYGHIVQEVIELQPGPLYPISELLDTKETIRQSIENLLMLVQDPNYKNDLEIGLFFLDNFIPDEEVPADPEENRRKWVILRFGHNP